MEDVEENIITVHTTVNAPVEKVWTHWTSPESITKWNNASADWHTSSASNDLRAGGKFSYRMEEINGKRGFDFEGVYEKIILNQHIEYSIGDGRKVVITFSSAGNQTDVIESFEAEKIHPVEHQRSGWQAILDNFKRFVEQSGL